jgi:hypothetical protein
MAEYESVIDADGCMVVPEELRREAGQPGRVRVCVIPEIGGFHVRFLPARGASSPERVSEARSAVLRVQGAIKAPGPMSDDFDDEIEEAMAAEMAEQYPWTLSR